MISLKSLRISHDLLIKIHQNPSQVLVGFLFLQLFLQVLREVIGHGLQDSHDGRARGLPGIRFLKEGSALHELHLETLETG